MSAPDTPSRLSAETLRALQAAWDVQPDLPPIDFTGAEAAALAAALTANQGAGEGQVPEGWQLVPEVPTAEMTRAGSQTDDPGPAFTFHSQIYAAMLAASPTPPVRGGE